MNGRLGLYIWRVELKAVELVTIVRVCVNRGSLHDILVLVINLRRAIYILL